jgi:cytochrome c2
MLTLGVQQTNRHTIPAAAVPGFAYSDAMPAKGAAGLVCDAATLERYTAKTRVSVIEEPHQADTMLRYCTVNP